VNAPLARPADPLSERLARLRAFRREPGWADELLGLGRDLMLAQAGVVLARGAEGWQAIAPATGEAPPDAWIGLADAAASGRGVVAAEAGPGGRWIFAAAAGPADPPGSPARQAVLVLEVASTLPMDLVLTRERMAFLGTLAEAGAVEAALAARAPQALAAAAAEALFAAPDRDAGLQAAAALLAASGMPSAERVALLLPHRRQVALSDQRRADTGAELPRRLLALAEEALDRGGPRRALPGEAPSPAERAFHEAFGPRPVVSVAAAGGGLVLVATFPPGTAVPEDAGARLLPVATMLGALAAAPARRRGPGRRNLLAAAAAGLLLLAGFLPRAALVEAPMVLRPERARLVTAPFDGLLDASDVQPGDAVTAGGTSLARLATREVELELAAARARAANDLRDAAVARANGQPAQEQISLLSARRAEAQVALLEYRLRLAEIRAPEDGVIIAGDLRRTIGQPLSRGQTLFEIALPGPLRAEILVLDEDSRTVREGQRVWFATAAEPGRAREGVVERIRPMAEVVDGRNVFRVIARIAPADAATGTLRPGMEGWARIETGQTTWLMSILADPVRWVRRRFWI
jgi:hypothetical protein